MAKFITVEVFKVFQDIGELSGRYYMFYMRWNLREAAAMKSGKMLKNLIQKAKHLPEVSLWPQLLTIHVS